MCRRRLAHADAAVATCLVQPRADVNQAGDVAVAHQRLELRPGRWADVERNAVVHASTAHHRRRNSEIAIARIGGGTHIGLVDPLASDFAHRSYMPRAGRHGDQWLQARQIDLVMEVVVRARISDQFHPVVFSLPGTQEAANLLVGGEDSRCCA